MADSKREFEALLKRLAAPARLGSWHDAPTLVPGSALGQAYRVVRLLGRGGMGEVYEVEHLPSGTRRALKCLLPALLHDDAALGRFLAEAQAASSLAHENIVRVLDSGVLDGRHYLCFELLEGLSLQAELTRAGQLSSAQLLPIVDALCSALALAHAHGIVHRDLKPANVFLMTRADGVLVKLMDFGVAKLLGGGATRLTTTGVALGTPHFMAPEQVRGDREIDGRTDIYALGVLMYYCLTGALPFAARTFAELAVLICTEPPQPLERRCPQLSPALADVVRCAMQKEPARRFSDVQALRQALRTAASAR